MLSSGLKLKLRKLEGYFRNNRKLTGCREEEKKSRSLVSVAENPNQNRSASLPLFPLPKPPSCVAGFLVSGEENDSSMADVENQQESALPVKRKTDLCCQEQDNIPNKAQKLQPLNSAASESKDGENLGNKLVKLDSSAQEKVETKSSNSEEKAAGSEAERDENGGAGDLRGEEEQEKGDDDGAEVDRKGKGFLRDDKGKGKLIEEDDSEDDEDSDEDDDEDDDSSDGGNETDGDSDLSDDPLAEVDLDNILPSRTRRRAIHPGLYISDEIGNPEDDDDSDA